MSAGILFTNNTHVLAGYQLINKHNKQDEKVLSGFGGKKENDETDIQTAIRETLEELFEINVTDFLVSFIEKILIPRKIIIQNNYTLFIFNFDDLLVILNVIKFNDLASKLYDVIPLTLTDLILNRKHYHESEISELSLLPIKTVIDGFRIDTLFMDDCMKLNN